MSRSATPPADGTEFANAVRREVRPEMAVELRMGPGTGPTDPGFVVEWQLLPLAERREPAKRSRAEKSPTVRLVDLGWQG